jgi:hypothetical protein
LEGRDRRIWSPPVKTGRSYLKNKLKAKCYGGMPQVIEHPDFKSFDEKRKNSARQM